MKSTFVSVTAILFLGIQQARIAQAARADDYKTPQDQDPPADLGLMTAAESHRRDFRGMDKNQDGKIDVTEVKTHYRDLGLYMSQEDISAYFIAADKDESGIITEEEYVYTSLVYDSTGLDLNDYDFM